MADIENIQAAEARVADLQDALSQVQFGLQKVEEVAVASERAKEAADRTLKVTLGLIGLSILLIVISRRRPR